MESAIHFRPATEEDIPALLWLIQLLAEELRDPRPNGPRIGKKELLRDGFGEHRYFNVLLAELDSLPQDLQPNHLPQDLPPHPLPQDLPPHPLPQDPPSPAPDVPLPSASMEKDEKLVGYALYFITYNSLDGRIMFLEDLYVRPEYRSGGLGTMLMKEIAKIGKDKDCCRMAWQVWAWNTRARKLYEKLGGKFLYDSLNVRMVSPTFDDFASS